MRTPHLSVLVVSIALLALAGCSSGEKAGQKPGEAPNKTPNATPAKTSTDRIMPSDLTYAGAFRLPGGDDEDSWGWGGQAFTYRPDGDPTGPGDGHPGSLFGTGHAWHQRLSEITIPRPVVSEAKKADELPVAKTLQPLQNVYGDMYPELELPRVGLALLPAQKPQTTGKLYFCRASHMGEGQRIASHGWCELTLKDPKTAGGWCIAGADNYTTAHYLFPISDAWAKQHVNGFRLATGRFRDGGQGSQGPVIFALAPWQDGNPPKRGAELKAVKLLHYSSVTDEEQHVLKNYHHSDEWTAGAWLTARDKAAVVFVGTKGEGKCWYGFANGVVWPEEGPWPPIPDPPNDQRGWWSERFNAQMLFYDPADLADVAAGKKKPYEPQPYATMSIASFLFAKKGPQQWYQTGGMCFDPARGWLYVAEYRGDGDKPLIHVWRVAP
jgi:hypothetical protein